MSMEATELFDKLCSNSRLERDKAERVLGEAVQEKESVLLRSVSEIAAAVVQGTDLSWEQKLGYLKAQKCLVGLEVQDENHVVVELSLRWLAGEQEEVRVKEAAGECLGVLCSYQGIQLYNKCLPPVLQLIRVNLQRRIEPDKDDTSVGKLMDRKEWKNLAAWKDLDLSLSCLQRMVEGLGSQAERKTNTEILELVLSCLRHKNRFVRDSGYRTCRSLARSRQVGVELGGHLSPGLTDSWAQVRLSATAATGELLVSLSPAEREELYPVLLPRLCLNRYFPGEGVRLEAQSSWREVCGEEGRNLLARNISQTVEYYLVSAGSDSQGGREAACHCISELVTKLPPSSVTPHLPALMDSLALCLEDSAWSVREAASVAASTVLRQQPHLASSRVGSLLPVFTRHLQDPVSSVRQAAALSLSNTVRACGGEVLSTVTEVIRRGLAGVRDQERDEVVRDEVKAEPWEVGEACVQTVAELSKVKEQQELVSSLLLDIFNSCEWRHYPYHLQYCASVCRCLAQIATNLDKRHFKRHLELDVVFLCLEGDSPTARDAASHCLSVLSRVLGPNILRGRVENLNPNFLPLHDSLMGGPASLSGPRLSSQPASLSGPRLSSQPASLSGPRLSSQPVTIPRANSSNYPSLGGTPPS